MSAPSRNYTNAAGNSSNAHESTNRGLFDFGMVVLGNEDAMGWCPVCFGKLDMNGATNEHILTNTEHRQIFGTDMTDAEYNAETNLMQVHARCNASKGTRGIFATWRAGQPAALSNSQYAALIGILDHWQNNLVKSSIGHFAKNNYKQKIEYVVSVVTGRTKETIEEYIKRV